MTYNEEQIRNFIACPKCRGEDNKSDVKFMVAFIILVVLVFTFLLIIN